MDEITKLIIPVAGKGTRFLPLSKAIPKELFPLGDKPLLYYALKEAREAGVQEIVFVANSSKKFIEDYFKRDAKLEAKLEEKGEKELLEAVQDLQELVSSFAISFIAEPVPLGDGHAILQAQRKIGSEPCFVMYPDDVILSKSSALSQLAQAFKTADRPVLGLFSMPKERISSYGVVAGESITKRIYKVKSIVEKPAPEQAPSNLAITGRAIITPDVFSYLKKAKPTRNGEVVFMETLGTMARDGKAIYAYELEGAWLECGSKKEWVKSWVRLMLQDAVQGKDLSLMIKEEKLLQ